MYDEIGHEQLFCRHTVVCARYDAVFLNPGPALGGLGPPSLDVGAPNIQHIAFST